MSGSNRVGINPAVVMGPGDGAGPGTVAINGWVAAYIEPPEEDTILTAPSTNHQRRVLTKKIIVQEAVLGPAAGVARRPTLGEEVTHLNPTSVAAEPRGKMKLPDPLHGPCRLCSMVMRRSV